MTYYWHDPDFIVRGWIMHHQLLLVFAAFIAASCAAFLSAGKPACRSR